MSLPGAGNSSSQYQPDSHVPPPPGHFYDAPDKSTEGGLDSETPEDSDTGKDNDTDKGNNTDKNNENPGNSPLPPDDDFPSTAELLNHPEVDVTRTLSAIHGKLTATINPSEGSRAAAINTKRLARSLRINPSGATNLPLEIQKALEVKFSGHCIQFQRGEEGDFYYRILNIDSDYQILPESGLSFNLEDESLIPAGDDNFDLKITGSERAIKFLAGKTSAILFVDELADYQSADFEHLGGPEKDYINKNIHRLSNEQLASFRRAQFVEADIDGQKRKIFKGYELGAGGFGEVSNGFFIADGNLRQCVIKEYYPRTQNCESAKMEKRNAEFLRSLSKNDENYPQTLVKVLATSENNAAKPFIIYQRYTHIDQGSINLREYMNTPEFIDTEIRQRLEILIDLARALSYLHKHRATHHDPKPANIMKTEKQAVLIDLDGLTFWEGDRRAGMTGTPNYTIPKLLMRPGPEYDIYALGKIAADLFEKYTFRNLEETDMINELLYTCQSVGDDGEVALTPALTIDMILNYLENVVSRC